MSGEIAMSILLSSKKHLVNQRMPQLIEGLHQKNINSIFSTALSVQPIVSLTDLMAWRISTLDSFGHSLKVFWPFLQDKH
jgi:hypothetical protein